MLAAIREGWGWTGIEPAEVIGVNAFGNLIARDIHGRYWRICPEDVYCKVVADSTASYHALLNDKDFVDDWEMSGLVNEARETVGQLESGQSYCLKVPGILGGAYGGENLATISTIELIRFSGDLGRQIRDLPDGSKIELRVVE